MRTSTTGRAKRGVRGVARIIAAAPERWGKWFSERLPIQPVLWWSLHEPIPGGASVAYIFGGLLLFTFLIQVVTGIWMLAYYAPTVGHAYQSITYLRRHVPFGWLMHNLHFWGWNAFVILMAVHMSRVAIWGAYRRPRELTWIIGVVIIILSATMIFTGALLLWDQTGYWAAEVGTSLLGNFPLIGGFLEGIARGGPAMTQLTLSRFFCFHVAMFAALLAAFISLHLVSFRHYGSAGPWSPERAIRREGWFWPDQIAIDLIAVSLLFLVLVGLSAAFPQSYSGLADPRDTTYIPLPEWNFLFFYEILKVLPGWWETFGVLVIPLLIFATLFLWPFFDSGTQRRPRTRWFWLLAGFLLVCVVITLTILGALSKPATFVTPAPPVHAPVEAAAPPAGPAQPSAAVGRGQAVFAAQGCVACHKVNGRGGAIGPDLSAEGTRGRSPQWLTAQLRNPKGHNPNTVMPAYTSLTDRQLADLVAYLESLRASGGGVPAATPAPAPPPVPTRTTAAARAAATEPSEASRLVGGASHGETIYVGFCQSCHGPRGKGGVSNPGSTAGTVPALDPLDRTLFSKDPDRFASRLDPFLQQGSIPAGPHPALSMPAFGAMQGLTQPQIASVEAYILALNGVDRGRIVNPGVDPWLFWVICAGALVALWLGIGTYFALLGRRSREG